MSEKIQRPQLVVLAAPSGGGKTTICKKLLAKEPHFILSVSATTRPPRRNEENGVDYYFLSEQEFTDKITNGEFLEYEQVHGHYYGTLKSKLKKLFNLGGRAQAQTPESKNR
jgi:guanylate kinase